MILTFYYITTALYQSWKFRSIYTKISEKISEKTSVVFYKVPENDIVSGTSDLCTNKNLARISDFLWLNGNQRGCTLLPLQSLHIGPWISFSDELSSLIPFDYKLPKKSLPLVEDNKLYLLLETNITPVKFGCHNEMDLIKIENYGKPIAWKVDSHFAILLETDINYFTKLLMATFIQEFFIINDYLTLIRIESLKYEGQPQPLSLLKNHLRKDLLSRADKNISSSEWEKHLEGLRSLSVLASQATEFQYNKNRTEGKTGAVKPDLIPISTPIKAFASSSNNEESTSAINDLGVDAKKIPEINESTSFIESLPENDELKIEIKPTNSNNIIIESEINTENVYKQPINQSKVEPNPIQSQGEPNPIQSQTEPNPIQPVTKDNPTDDINKSSNTPKDGSLITTESAADKLILKETESQHTNKKNYKSSGSKKRPSLKRIKGSLSESKPPNVLVYSNSSIQRDGVIASLKNILESDTYTIYPLTAQQIQQKIWTDNTCLLVVCGTVDTKVGESLLQYFLKGGKMLSLCSDLLHIILPTYRTAEVREHELVQFSYDKWQKVKMMHHIFCYQPSPVKKHFSTESDESTSNAPKKPALVCPRSVEMKDLQGHLHNLDVKILGTEETWSTPSILLANNISSGGKAVFSQVHLETDFSQYELDEAKYSVLKQNDNIRLEIFSDLLKNHLNISVKNVKDLKANNLKCVYKNAYFLGCHEKKFELIEKLKSTTTESNNLIQTSKLALKFCDKNERPPSATTNLLPILIHSCPEDFSTVDYFDNLKSKSVGRLVIYAPVVSSSMYVISDLMLTNGIAVIPKHQTDGSGRSSNQWLSPEGCAMFSLQLHIPLNSILGRRIPIIQHLLVTAIVNAILKVKGYEDLDIRIKWPNDIYANGITKIGGLIVASTLYQDTAVCNIGCGINLNNSTPTTCINDLIREYNRNHNKQVPLLEYEKFLATIFSEIESLYNIIQDGKINYLNELYYKYWLHANQKVKILNNDNIQKSATVIGIDEYGYLKVQLDNGKIDTVQPDGNSFDMLKGLILPK